MVGGSADPRTAAHPRRARQSRSRPGRRTNPPKSPRITRTSGDDRAVTSDTRGLAATTDTTEATDATRRGRGDRADRPSGRAAGDSTPADRPSVRAAPAAAPAFPGLVVFFTVLRMVQPVDDPDTFWHIAAGDRLRRDVDVQRSRPVEHDVDAAMAPARVAPRAGHELGAAGLRASPGSRGCSPRRARRSRCASGWSSAARRRCSSPRSCSSSHSSA